VLWALQVVTSCSCLERYFIIHCPINKSPPRHLACLHKQLVAAARVYSKHTLSYSSLAFLAHCQTHLLFLSERAMSASTRFIIVQFLLKEVSISYNVKFPPRLPFMAVVVSSLLTSSSSTAKPSSSSSTARASLSILAP
jgi:hypothetical protein